MHYLSNSLFYYVMDIFELYRKLMSEFGPQGWWPIICEQSVSSDNHGYHRRNHLIPVTAKGKLEMALGAILTQNTSWKNVEAALEALYEETRFSAEEILDLNLEELARIIHSSGYHRQKSKKIRKFLEFYQYLEPDRAPRREDLLSLWGVGPETADSILLYAYKLPYFVVDAYTFRIFRRLGIWENKDYHKLQNFIQDEIPSDYVLYNEFHALLVAHGKAYCTTRKPSCSQCFLSDYCPQLTAEDS